MGYDGVNEYISIWPSLHDTSPHLRFEIIYTQWSEKLRWSRKLVTLFHKELWCELKFILGKYIHNLCYIKSIDYTHNIQINNIQ